MRWLLHWTSWTLAAVALAMPALGDPPAAPTAAVASNPVSVSATAPLKLKQVRVGKVKVTGNKYYTKEFILKQLAPALKGPLDKDVLEHQLRLLNEFGDLQVKAVLRAGEEPGTADVDLVVEDHRPFHGTMEYNNFGNSLTGANRPGVTLAWTDLSGVGDSFLLRGVEAFPSPGDSLFYQAIYSYPTDSHGTHLNVIFANGDFAVGQELTQLNIFGVADIFGMTVSKPAERSETGEADLSAGLFEKSFRNFLVGEPSSRDELRELVATYSGSWFGQKGSLRTMEADVTYGLGSGVLGGTAIGDTNTSRIGVSNAFTKVDVNAAYIFKTGKRSFLLLRGSGQYSGDRLSVGEEFSLGGPDSVRGYPVNQALGDIGWVMSAEYRVPLQKVGPLQGALFLDTGQAIINRPQAGETQVSSLTGGGVGLRFPLGKETFVRTDLGFPFSPGVNSNGNAQIFYGQVQQRF